MVRERISEMVPKVMNVGTCGGFRDHLDLLVKGGVAVWWV